MPVSACSQDKGAASARGRAEHACSEPLESRRHGRYSARQSPASSGRARPRRTSRCLALVRLEIAIGLEQDLGRERGVDVVAAGEEQRRIRRQLPQQQVERMARGGRADGDRLGPTRRPRSWRQPGRGRDSGRGWRRTYRPRRARPPSRHARRPRYRTPGKGRGASRRATRPSASPSRPTVTARRRRADRLRSGRLERTLVFDHHRLRSGGNAAHPGTSHRRCRRRRGVRAGFRGEVVAHRGDHVRAVVALHLPAQVGPDVRIEPQHQRLAALQRHAAGHRPPHRRRSPAREVEELARIRAELGPVGPVLDVAQPARPSTATRTAARTAASRMTIDSGGRNGATRIELTPPPQPSAPGPCRSLPT